MSVQALPAIPAPPRLLKISLAVVAGIELIGALAQLAILFHDYGHTDSLLIFAQKLTSLRVALTPLILGAALFFAVSNRLRHAIIALATLMLLAWLTDLPSIAIHGFGFTPDFGGAYMFAKLIIAPAAAAVAIRFAMTNERLPLAGLLVSLPTIAHWLGVTVFGIGVAIYGF
jgi:hypothetical protein